MIYTFKRLRRKTFAIRWGSILVAVLLFLLDLPAMHRLLPIDGEMLGAFSSLSSMMVIIFAAAFELLRTMPIALNDPFGRMLPIPERTPIVASFCSLLLSGILFLAVSIAITIGFLLLRYGDPKSLFAGITFDRSAVFFLLSWALQLFVAIALMLFIQTAHAALTQKRKGGLSPLWSRLLEAIVFVVCWFLLLWGAQWLAMQCPLGIMTDPFRLEWMTLQDVSFYPLCWAMAFDVQQLREGVLLAVFASEALIGGVLAAGSVALAEDRIDW